VKTEHNHITPGFGLRSFAGDQLLLVEDLDMMEFTIAFPNCNNQATSSFHFQAPNQPVQEKS
jgi:hypothetical protein